ncbi:DUF3025 domain-containing protein [Frateuria aurantia]|uniref:DUF3025 domain-containing protein n=1 Tax=Frateuria aurantia (strain ATCC 33424 / DSM 6220 / KCTC 2777 / LMG 1558 / NBRC 3245 / NCIMB 13370) TaxID=767434 RepID=H8L6I2_FRAAD|nr:DUF3025 domain-containing protein [Frateuria aurantia]AFC85971.1 Protein of unknown function (DUF3025) [Frateuria aurantia DSM 6220]
MRFRAPEREAVNPAVFRRPPLRDWLGDHADWLMGPDWPDAGQLTAALPMPGLRFVRQDAALLADGLHYEARIALHGAIATRPENWHDLFNALIWLRYPGLKQALNLQQMLEIDKVGARTRSRVQCALTHFDEAGVMVRLRDPALLALWDRHDWAGLFLDQREAWRDGRIECRIFGHALLEHALVSGALLVGKAMVVLDQRPVWPADTSLAAILASEIADGRQLRDPQALRPLPLSGIAGWYKDDPGVDFYRQAPCFRPLRPGRAYPSPILAGAD